MGNSCIKGDDDTNDANDATREPTVDSYYTDLKVEEDNQETVPPVSVDEVPLISLEEEANQETVPPISVDGDMGVREKLGCLTIKDLNEMFDHINVKEVAKPPSYYRNQRGGKNCTKPDYVNAIVPFIEETNLLRVPDVRYVASKLGVRTTGTSKIDVVESFRTTLMARSVDDVKLHVANVRTKTKAKATATTNQQVTYNNCTIGEASVSANSGAAVMAPSTQPRIL